MGFFSRLLHGAPADTRAHAERVRGRQLEAAMRAEVEAARLDLLAAELQADAEARIVAIKADTEQRVGNMHRSAALHRSNAETLRYRAATEGREGQS